MMADLIANESTLEQRLLAIEGSVTELQRQLAAVSRSSHWLTEVIGSVTEESAFREVIEHGRAFRAAESPPDMADDRP